MIPLLMPDLPDAACMNSIPEDWFPGERDKDIAADAKAVCRSCPERLACLQWALDNDERHGVWGGLDEDERLRMVRNNARKSRAKETTE